MMPSLDTIRATIKRKENQLCNSYLKISPHTTKVITETRLPTTGHIMRRLYQDSINQITRMTKFKTIGHISMRQFHLTTIPHIETQHGNSIGLTITLSSLQTICHNIRKKKMVSGIIYYTSIQLLTTKQVIKVIKNRDIFGLMLLLRSQKVIIKAIIERVELIIGILFITITLLITKVTILKIGLQTIGLFIGKSCHQTT